jgi:hypothetical protein
MGKSIRNLSTVTRVGLDLAKRVFQVHAVDAKASSSNTSATSLTPPWPRLSGASCGPFWARARPNLSDGGSP